MLTCSAFRLQPVVLPIGFSIAVACRLAVEVLDAQVVVEKVRNASLEAVQLRQGILTDGDEEVDPQIGAVDRPRELDGEVPSPSSWGW